VEGRPPDDDKLVAQAKRGDVGAYEELVRRYQVIAFRTALLISGNESDAQDATQTAFVKAYYALDRFRHRAPFKPWPMRIVANEARNQCRSARRRSGLELRLSEDRPREDAAPSPEAAILAREPRQALVKALNELRERDRLVIAYRYFLDLSEVEMAEALGCTRGTVKSRLSRAMARLRAELTQSGTELVEPMERQP
jgi:RNA polymerase sigma-70 factor (ECF subfamily)